MKTRGLPANQGTVGQAAITPMHPFAKTVGTPNIARANVETYMLKHPFPSGPLMPGASLKILSIDLITSRACAIRLNGEETGLSDTAFVYYVKVQGPFSTAMVPLAPGAKPFPPASFGIEVFDAQTGNLLIWSIPTQGSKS